MINDISVERQRRMSRLRVLIVTVIVVCAAIGTYLGRQYYRNLAEAQQFQLLLDDLDRSDPHWRLQDLEAARARVPDAENSVSLIRAAHARITRFQPPTLEPSDWTDQANPDHPAVALDDTQLRSVIDLLESVESAIAPTLAIEHTPRGRHPIAYRPDAISTLLPHFSDMSEIHHRVLRPLLLCHQHEGDAAAAVRDCICMLHLAWSTGDEPFAVSQNFRTRLLELAIRGIERTLGQVVASEPDLARLQAKIAEEAAYDAWPVVVRGERGVVQQIMVAIGDGILRPSVVRKLAQAMQGATRSSANRALDWLDDRFPADLTRSHVWVLQRATRILDETVPLPWHERTAAVAAIVADDDSAPELVAGWSNVPKMLEHYQSHQALVRSLLVAISCERYRLQNGRWPDATAELVPGLLPELPVDPFDGKPLRYRRLPDGIVIYSVGADGQDDGGQVLSVEAQAAATDVGIRLWDVNRRRQPPATERTP